MGTAEPPKLVEAHCRLFADDVEALKRIAISNGTRWHIELRLLVRRALRGERREVIVLKDQT